MMVRTAFVRDIRSSTPGFGAASAARRCFVGAEGAGTTPSYWLDQRGHQLRQTFEIKRPADQVRLLANAIEPSAAEATQPVPVLTLSKELPDLLSASLRELVAEAPPSHPDARMRALAPAVPDVPFETNRQSGSLTEWCVALPRFSPRKLTARL